MSVGRYVLISAPPIVSAHQTQHLLIPLHHNIRMVTVTIGLFHRSHPVSVGFQCAHGGFSGRVRNRGILQRFARLPVHHQILDLLILIPDRYMNVGNLDIDDLLTILMGFQNRF